MCRLNRTCPSNRIGQGVIDCTTRGRIGHIGHALRQHIINRVFGWTSGKIRDLNGIGDHITNSGCVYIRSLHHIIHTTFNIYLGEADFSFVLCIGIHIDQAIQAVACFGVNVVPEDIECERFTRGVGFWSEHRHRSWVGWFIRHIPDGKGNVIQRCPRTLPVLHQNPDVIETSRETPLAQVLISRCSSTVLIFFIC